MWEITEKGLLSTYLVVVVHHLASRQFTFLANQIHVLGLIISTEGSLYMGIHADVIVYIFTHLHTTLRTEENLLGIY